jgi:hypothetical protein
MALFHMQLNVKSIDGGEMPLMTVIAESLRYISNRALSKLEEQIGKGVNKNKIRWVLTVPALWSEEHKLFMRKAAVEAGIIDHSNSPSLLLCLEVIISIIFSQKEHLYNVEKMQKILSKL